MSNGLHRQLRVRPASLARVVASVLLLVGSLMSLGQGQPGGAPTGASPAAVPAARQAHNIAVITIRGEITETTYTSVKRRMSIAQRAGADALVFELDTPGGELGAVLGICNEIKASPIRNTVAWINDDAYSGGAVIALACREVVISDPSTMGDALPIAMSFGMLNQLPEHERQKVLAPLIAELVDSARRNNYDEMLVQGIAARGVELWLVENRESGARLFITRDEYRLIFGEDPAATAPSIASAPALAEEPQMGPPAPIFEAPQSKGRRSGRAPRAARPPAPPPSPDDPRRFVPASERLQGLAGEVTLDQDLPLARPVITSADRGRWVLLEYVSTGSGPLVFKADHMRRYGLASATITSDEQLKAFFGARHLIRLEPTWSEGLVAFMTLWYIRAILVVAFLVGLFVEMTHPGLVAPGAVAMAALVGLIAPPLLVDMSAWWTVAAILGGILLIAIEIFVIPGFGVPGVLGLLLLFAGLVGTLVPTGAFFPDTPAQRNDLLFGIATLLMAVATSGAIMYFLGKHVTSLPMINRLVLKDPVPTDDQAGREMLGVMAQAPIRAGMAGTAVTPLRPAGRVQLGDRIIDAVSDVGYIPAGAAVKVASVTEFRVGVEPA